MSVRASSVINASPRQIYMLELRPGCECCNVDLPPGSEAFICSFECTFCKFCTEQTLQGVCPNCEGELRMSKIKFESGGIRFGEDELFFISGPCVIEDESVMLKTAETLAEVRNRLKIGIVYKSSFQKDNRSSADYYSGPGLEKGLRILEKIKKQFGFPLLTDVHYPEQVAPAAEVIDIIQIPAYLCMQTTLTLACGNSGQIINIKHGQFLAPKTMEKPIKKLNQPAITHYPYGARIYFWL
ncbi:hypothetical protein CHS0354_001990 [Potamilus streckersoni]|uniref:3-deoxy-8-phosphooctulonate synthase n=1 Tax=Potamilus streckersoni TaxID=2493646 RepID=A0AAE0T5G9_9BIVA|nr:hypothetical protein CHS0354_001990 [Potamilus streckersoni]